MVKNFEQLIDLYFDGRMSAAEQTEFLHLVGTDPAAAQLFAAEELVRGTISTDLSSLPQAATEPGAELLAKLAATKPLAQAASQEVIRQTAQQTGSTMTRSLAGSGMKSVSNLTMNGGLAGVGKTILGLSTGAFQAVTGVVVAVGISVGVYIAQEPSQTSVMPSRDSSSMEVLTPAPLLVDSPLAPVTEEAARMADPQPDRLGESTTPSASVDKSPVLPDMSKVDLSTDFKEPRRNAQDTAAIKLKTQSKR